MKVHQPNLPAPEFIHKSPSKSKYADSVVENDTRIGHIMDKVRALGLDKNTYVFWTSDNGAWQDVYPDAGYTPFRGTKGTDREGGSRVPSIAWGPGIKPRAKTRRSSAVSTTWRPSPHSAGRSGRRTIAKETDHFRQLRPVAGTVRQRPVAAILMVLFHRERTDTRSGAGRSLQGRI